MKYILVAAGLLFSLTAFAVGPGNTDDSRLESSQNGGNSQSSSKSDLLQVFSKPSCQAFCDQYGAAVQTCDINVTGPEHTYSAPDDDGHPAMASGNSLSLTYNVVCGPSTH